jgi:hypothetical protein
MSWARLQTKSEQTTITLSPTDLETLIRRVEREELSRLVQSEKPSILDDWSHESPDDPEGDAELLQEALAAIEAFGHQPETWSSWEDFQAELRRTEAAGELPA